MTPVDRELDDLQSGTPYHFAVDESGGTCGYLWQAPGDLELEGNEETFTIEIKYDTRELYGTVTGTRGVTVCKKQCAGRT